MNERIKQITVQALEKSLFEPIDPTISAGEGENKVTIPLVFAEKFAELIVRECADLHDMNSGYYDDNNEWCSYYDVILKHFGIE